MNITPAQYSSLVNSTAKKSPIIKNVFYAFIVGGSICALGQGIRNTLLYYFPYDTDIATNFTPVILIFLAMLFTGFGLYDSLAKYAGAGTIVPITGFANAIVSPAMEFKSEGIVLGLGAKMFALAGPVLVFGISSSVIYGLILYFLKLFYK